MTESNRPNRSARRPARRPARTLGPRNRAVLGWALAPVLAGLAVLAQYIIDVPKAEMLTREDAKAEKDKAAARDTGDDGDGGKPKKVRPRKRGKSYSARKDAERRALRGRWSERSIEEEPTDQAFRRHHEALLRTIVTRVRANAMQGHEPTPMQIRPDCHTIRCTLELCAERELLADIAEGLADVSIQGSSLWHELREVEPKREPAKRDAMKNHQCRRWVVDFSIEGVSVGQLDFDDGGDDETEAG